MSGCGDLTWPLAVVIKRLEHARATLDAGIARLEQMEPLG